MAVLAGTTLGMMIANVPAGFLGEVAATRLPLRLVHGICAAVFAVIDVLSLIGVVPKLTWIGYVNAASALQ